MKKLLLIGSYGSGNLGDEALKELSLKVLGKKYECFVLTGNPKKTNEAAHFPFGVRSLLKMKWIKSFRLLKQTDAVIFAGGGLFAEHETLRAILLWTSHVFWAWLFRKPIHFIGQSVGPFKTRLGKALTRWSLSKASSLILRDSVSAETVRKNFPNIKFQTSTDLCFGYEPKENHPQKRIALNLRPWKGNPAALQETLKNYKEKGYEIHAIAMDHIDKKALAHFGKVENFESFDELIAFLSTCEFCIGMRLHFLIAAALSGSKVVGLSYSQKVRGLLKSIEVPTLNFEEVNEENFEAFIQEQRAAKNIAALHKEALALLEQFSI